MTNLKSYRLGDPEDDLFSDAMDRAISMYHSVMHGAMRNAERAGEADTMRGEKIARRALAAGFKAYLEEIRPDDIDRWQRLVARMLPYVQQTEPADFAEIEAQTCLEAEALKALAGLPVEPTADQS